MCVEKLKAEAEAGDAEAQYWLGLNYFNGGDQVEAVKWLHKAAEQGNGQARYYLGCFCAEGKDAPKDYVDAYVWYNLAAGNGDVDGKRS